MFLTALRAWLGLVGSIAIVNGATCFVDATYPSRMLYTANPTQVTPLASRLFGVWTLLAGALRVASAINTADTTLYVLTIISFVLANVHFVSEIWVYRTAKITGKTISPLVVSGVSILWMLVAYSDAANSYKSIHA
ncbi:hypothetical protein CAOG_04184 [Capsaspora owczarzaki ATCC 30864]|uniref:Ergosterol biosynthetic protein 28 n=1 Tax=Capsaspora owczarzaki (strain ATCC 30864) TaxID=595528 RepID=A0A0D2UE44_CAPO3|nr:hypothetical protein CAOG_04184 [Capsaspora owczarzaki ATCC 30864]KJE93391.1 hypothetical protein CAOG_004184 [Capsaspora owczarzaki ATCC 30864]|eukprot:XP_004348009.1 hypothetical protein CAOG_04184 [Capsaspora owczarzaki ATCC 30864]